MKGYIYLIENKINDKKYVGKTYRKIELRWKEHIKEVEKGNFLNRPLGLWNKGWSIPHWQQPWTYEWMDK